MVRVHAHLPHFNTEAEACPGTALKAQGVQAGRRTQKQAAATPANPSQLQEALQAPAMFSHTHFPSSAKVTHARLACKMRIVPTYPERPSRSHDRQGFPKALKP